jgi:peptidoglycan hydrolase-like protein with peptidoglycan-binding domain
MALTDFVLNSDDFDAIDSYMRSRYAKTATAETLKRQYISWSNGLWPGQKYTDGVIQEAHNRRNAFNVANTDTPAERQNVKAVIAQGQTIEENRGKPKVVDDAGNYPKAKGITVGSASRSSVPKTARPLIKLGARGDAVRAWQSIVGVPLTGVFDSDTDSATRKFQSAHGLKVDGKVGTMTWTAALANADLVAVPPAIADITPVAPTNASPQSVAVGTVIPVQAATTAPAKTSQRPVKPIAVADSMAPVAVVKPKGLIPKAKAFSQDHPVAASIGSGAIITVIAKLFGL